uniref:uncharacterized protein LOC118547399 n=1 Tax=Halichoerus grypus TaxID=9711 RepID=UPI001659F856|nr:uncharacterized protein LOC118547399 [Halichoerus grypus]
MPIQPDWSDVAVTAVPQPAPGGLPFPVLTLPTGWPAAWRHRSGPFEGAPQRVFLDEGEGTGGEQWASVAAGRQALPVNPSLGLQLGGASPRPGLRRRTGRGLAKASLRSSPSRDSVSLHEPLSTPGDSAPGPGGFRVVTDQITRSVLRRDYTRPPTSQSFLASQGAKEKEQEEPDEALGVETCPAPCWTKPFTAENPRPGEEPACCFSWWLHRLAVPPTAHKGSDFLTSPPTPVWGFGIPAILTGGRWCLAASGLQRPNALVATETHKAKHTSHLALDWTGGGSPSLEALFPTGVGAQACGTVSGRWQAS